MEPNSKKFSPAASIIGENEDLLVEVLQYLPARSLLRFKSVSKQWFAIIINSLFVSQYHSKPNPPSGLFLFSTLHNEVDFLPLDAKIASKSPLRILNSGVQILSSCNGLLCCCRYAEPETELYVCNPSNNKYALVPNPRFFDKESILGVDLAFDPSKSPIYKVILTTVTTSLPDTPIVCNRTYSSETRDWKDSKPVIVSFIETTRFNHGVYCNGAIHWYSAGLHTVYFDIDQGQIVVMPMPKMTYETQSGFRRCRYIGESSGHLHIIETYGRIAPDLPNFNVFEMEKDRSGWFVKYRVNLDPMAAVHSEMRHSYKSVGFFKNEYSLLYILETDNNEDSYLFLRIPGKIMRYNLRDKSFEVHMEFYPTRKDAQYQVFPFFECLLVI